MPRVVITMPAYRAQGTVGKTVADIPPGVADRLILVDDASPDNTAQVARDLGLDVHVHPQNRGYGGNQKTCYTLALQDGADVVVLLHPDYQYDPRAVPLLIAPILAGHADMTFGSRFAALGDPVAGGMPLYRFLGNRITTTLQNLLLGSRYTEMHSGLRAYTRSFLLSQPFLRYSDDFAFDSQLLVDALTSGQRVVEVPIRTRYTRESSSIPVGRSLRYVTESLAYAARRAAERGRRGRRSPATFGGPRRAPSLRGVAPAEGRCALCGGRDLVLLYRSNVSEEPAPSAFACTSEQVGAHDDIVQCRRCGLVSSRPPLGAREIRERYEAVEDPEYLEEEEARRELFGWILDRASGYFVPGRRLLEVGSHVGLFLDAARGRGWRARGIEPSSWAVRTGRERFGVDLRQGTVESLDEPPGSADAVVLLDVLEHLVDPLVALAALRGTVHPEGLLLLTTVNLSSVHARLRRGSWPWFIAPHLHYFTPQTLHTLLEQAGFRVVEWSPVPRSFHLSYVVRRGGSALGPAGRVLGAVAEVVDPRVPLGWLGDVVLVIARPSRSAR